MFRVNNTKHCVLGMGLWVEWCSGFIVNILFEFYYTTNYFLNVANTFLRLHIFAGMANRFLDDTYFS